MRDETDYDNFWASTGTAGFNDRVVDRIETSNRFSVKFDSINQKSSEFPYSSMILKNSIIVAMKNGVNYWN